MQILLRQNSQGTLQERRYPYTTFDRITSSEFSNPFVVSCKAKFIGVVYVSPLTIISPTSLSYCPPIVKYFLISSPTHYLLLFLHAFLHIGPMSRKNASIIFDINAQFIHIFISLHCHPFCKIPLILSL